MAKLSISDLLLSSRAALVSRWVDKVQEKLPGERELNRDEIINSMNLFLDELFFMLTDDDDTALSMRRSALARVHGGQRQTLGRGVAELAREYGLLLEAMVDLANEKHVPIPTNDMLELSTYLFAGAAEAVDQFTQQTFDERRKIDFESFAFVAHELRNPLSSLSLAWQLVSPNVPEGKATTVLTRSIQRLISLIDNTIAGAKLQSIDAGTKIRGEDVSLQELLQDAVQESAFDAEAKKVAIQLECANVRINGDPRLLRSAVTNLLRNAVKFTHPDGQVRLSCRVDGGRILIKVEDQCGGLKAGAAEGLFSAFLQTNRDRTGFGLGLAIAKQAIEAHKGYIVIKDQPGVGCVFIIDLPAA